MMSTPAAGLRRFILPAAGLALLVAAFAVSDGLYNIDEMAYLMGAEAIASRGSLIVENGLTAFRSPDLLLWVLVAGPNGATPQYPVGSAVVGGLFYALFSARGLIVLNALAAVATLFLTRSLARLMYGEAAPWPVALVLLAAGTFWLEYAFGIWPHAVSACAVTAALVLALKAIAADAGSGSGAAGRAVACGLAVGAGFLFRTDTVLVLPAVAAIVILGAASPIRLLTAAAAGLVPALAAAAAANRVKFGTWNPLTYGTSGGGGIDPSSHLVAAAATGLLLAVLAGVRFATWRPASRPVLAAAALAVAALVLAVAPLAEAAGRYLDGAWAILGDARTITDVREDVVRTVQGVQLFWGFPKQALGQSMPWLGILLFLLVRPWAGRRRANAVVVFVAGIWSAPFFMLAWHGGLGSNMRYLLPLLPLLAVAAAQAWSDLEGLARARAWPALVGVLAGVLAVAGWSVAGPARAAGAQQILATWLFCAAAAVSLAAGLFGPRVPALAAACRVVVAAGFGAALVYAADDVEAAQVRRAMNAATAAALADIGPPSLFHGVAEFFAFQVGRPDALIATKDRLDGTIDAALLRDALAAGYRVFLQAGAGGTLPPGLDGLAATGGTRPLPGGVLVELTLRQEGSRTSTR